MSVSPGTLAIVGAVLGLFLGGAVAGIGLARALAPGSWVAETVSFFALPIAFAAGLQAWYGLALFSLIPRLLRGLGGSYSGAARAREPRPLRLPGSFVFLPLSSGAGAVAGIVVGLVSSTDPVWFVALVYWLVGTAHGLLAWRLARSGVLLPPESV
jgi:hypothetical protein